MLLDLPQVGAQQPDGVVGHDGRPAGKSDHLSQTWHPLQVGDVHLSQIAVDEEVRREERLNALAEFGGQ